MDIEKLRELDATDLRYIGERLKMIRLELNGRYTGADKKLNPFTLTNMSENLDMAMSTLSNVERGQSLANSLKIVFYFYSFGYNPVWILLPENDFVPMRNLGENLTDQEEIKKNFVHMEKAITEALSAFKKDL